MNWGEIAAIATEKERSVAFLALQRNRYDNAPAKAALALWKGVCTQSVALPLEQELRGLARQGALPADEKAYLAALLHYFDLLAGMARDEAGKG